MMHNHRSFQPARTKRARHVTWLKIPVLRSFCLVGLGLVFLIPITHHTKAQQGKDVRVVVTTKPLHALASQVLDGIAVPKLLIDGAQSPHVFALKPSDAAALHQADLFVRTGSNVEPFTEKVRVSLAKTVHVLSAVDIDGVTHLRLRQSGAYEAHDHGDHGDHKDHDNHDDHKGHDDHSDHDHGAHKNHDHAGGRDPHIWLDPQNAIAVVKGLVAKLKEIAPQHADKLDANGKVTIARLTTLDTELKTKLAAIKGKPFIVFHDAFQYFENRFGLNGVGAITLHPEVPLSGKRLREIRKTIKTAGAKCVFSEPQFNAKRVATVAEGTGAQIGVLDPLGAKVPKGPDAYATMMHDLADSFDACLAK